MPKMKTKTAAKKRFKVSSSGKISHRHTHRSHNLEHKTRKYKRALRQDQPLAAADYKEAKNLLAPRI